MSVFAVIREAGPGWSEGAGPFEQPAVKDHGAFMNALADEGFALCAGPLAGPASDRFRVLLIAEAGTEADVHQRLAADPWVRAERLITTSVEPWVLVLGGERLSVNRHPMTQPGTVG